MLFSHSLSLSPPFPLHTTTKQAAAAVAKNERKTVIATAAKNLFA